MTSAPKRQPIPFGKYLLLDRVNIGGMAEVWRGKSFGAGGFERLVAIKRILPNIAEDEEFISMFIDEAKITVQLTHANIAQVYELGHIANSYFIAMEYIPGKDMRAIFDRGRKKGEPAPIPLTCYVVGKLCEGLDYAHRKKDGMGRDMNIVHRDVSPQNVLISYEGEVKVIDFGIAKAAGKATKTQAGILKGKFAYMSPEQIRGLPLDRRSDVFAIGVCLYEMLTGERLFVGDSDFSVLEKVRKAEVLPPSTYNRRIPEALEKIVLKALARDVEERYQYASELADDLQRFLITSDSIFSRKDLMQYMKSTFAEDVEREKLRIQDYADVKPSEGMLAALDMGMPSSPRPAPLPPPSPPSPRPAPPPLPAGAAVTVPGPVQLPRRSPTLAAVPKLTAAAPVQTKERPEESGATIVVEHGQYFGDTPTPPAPVPALTPAVAVPVGSPDSGVSTDVGTQPGPSEQTLPPEPPTLAVQPPALASLPRPPTLTPGRAQPPARGAPLPPPVPVDDDDAEPTYSTSGVSGPRRGLVKDKNPKILGAIAAAVLLLIAGLGVMLFKGPDEGFLFLQLPDALQGKARISLNGVEVDTSKWPPFEKVTAGTVAVMITADGWETFAGTVEVADGTEVTRYAPELKRRQDAAPAPAPEIDARPAEP